MITAKVSPDHKNHEQLHQELYEAKGKVQVGGIYSHYKHPENTYQVTGLAFIESTDELSVIYQATYDQGLVFVRPLSSWLETPNLNGKKVPRFKYEHC